MASCTARSIIVQAGGRGTRLEQYTWNKPKCLAPVDGKPLLYHLFDAFPDCRFFVIVDYKSDVVRHYLSVFPPRVHCDLVEVKGGRGNLAGISEASQRLAGDEPVIVTWCDLVFDHPPGGLSCSNVSVFTTDAFPCRWSMLSSGELVEKRSTTNGVVGVFGFPNAGVLRMAPAEGEFVAWLAQAGLPTSMVPMTGLREIGTVSALRDQWAEGRHARQFNSIEVSDVTVVKRAKQPEFDHLLAAEIAWYEHVREYDFTNVPRVLSPTPLTLERIRGRHPFEFAETERGRGVVLGRIIDLIASLHSLYAAPADSVSCRDMYHRKPLQRLCVIGRLWPEALSRSTFRVNGTLCRNILHDSHRTHFDSVVSEILPARFELIHGDPTFSNTIISNEGIPFFIDPRGTFGRSRFVGDPLYDWAKLWYSVVGDYDNFNRRHFLLDLDESESNVQIRPSGWGHLKGMIRDVAGNQFNNLLIIHATIWLSLSGYVHDDYDSMIAAYLNGLLLLEEATA